MNPHPMNISALDNQIARGVAGLDYSLDALDEPVFLYQRKLNGNGLHTTRARVFPTECAKLSVHLVHRVIFLTGGGFQPNSYRVRSCSSRADFLKTSLRSNHV